MQGYKNYFFTEPSSNLLDFSNEILMAQVKHLVTKIQECTREIVSQRTLQWQKIDFQRFFQWHIRYDLC